MPLSNEQITYALSAFPHLAALSRMLTNKLPPLISGSYMIQLTQNIDLVLHYHAAEKVMPELNFAANAWYLDGFAPSRNNDLWSQNIYENIARCSANEATLATYSVARNVRILLEGFGFITQKRQGIGKKRHVLSAKLSKKMLSSAQESSASNTAIIGAGFAGSATADALHRSGLQVDIYESEQSPASRASANSSAIIYFKPERLAHANQRLKWSAYVHALSYYAREGLQSHMHKKSILLAARDKRGKKWLDGWKSAFRKRALQGYMQLTSLPEITNDDETTILFPKGGSVDLPTACTVLLSQSTLYQKTKITNIEETSHGYLLTSNTGIKKEYQQVILTVNAGINSLAETRIKMFKGQLDYYKPLPNNTRSTNDTKEMVYCSSMFLNKGYKNWQAGANFQAHFNNLQPDKKIQESQRQQLHKDFPGLKIPNEHIFSWCDIRTTTPDYLPLCGLFAKHSLRADSGIYINLGHGGKGSLMIPLCAQLIAYQLQGWRLIPEYSLLDPMRFSNRLKSHQG